MPKLLVGLCTVSTRTKSYLHQTIKSLVENLSGETDTKIVLYHCDWYDVVSEEVQIVQEQFPQITVVRISDHNKFGLYKKQFENENELRQSWIVKQNCDASEALRLSQDQADYYLHVEDDIKACKNYDLHIFEEINKNINWGVMRLSQGGFIGWLFQNKDLSIMSNMLLEHKEELPCDHITDRYFIKYQLDNKKRIIFTPYSLFQHLGLERSLTDDINSTVFETFIEN